MKKIFLLIIILSTLGSKAQITVTIGSTLLIEPGTKVHLPVTITGLDAATGGTQVSAIELHILYSNSNLIYDTTINFCELASSSQWIFFGNGVEYATNWVEPNLNAISFPDNTVLFDIVFDYLGGSTELDFDESRCLFLDSNYETIPNIQYINGQVTPSQGSDISRWNGNGEWTNPANWSNGIPGENTDVVIETGQANIVSNALCKSLTINEESTILIDPNKSLTVNNNFTNNGTFHIVSDETGSGSFLNYGDINGNGNNIIDSYLNFSNNLQYLISSPINNVSASVAGNNTIEKYTESTSVWSTIATNENLENGIGYRTSGSDDYMISFNGNINNQDISLPNLSYTANSDNSLEGLHLIGNPFSCSLNWDIDGWNKNNIDQAIYCWDGYKYVSWNGITGSLNNGIISAMKGFFIKVNTKNASLTIPKNARVINNQKENKDENKVENLLVMKIENTTDNNHFDEAFVNINTNSSVNFDSQFDAYKYLANNEYAQISTKSNEGFNLSINTIPEFKTIPITTTISQSGSYKISFGGIETFASDQPLFLEDTKNNIATNIRNVNNYVFINEGAPESDRFVLHFQSLGIEENNNNVSAWIGNHVLHIYANNPTSYNIELFDTSGRNVFSANNFMIPGNVKLTDSLRGIYILRISDTKSVVSQKIVIY